MRFVILLALGTLLAPAAARAEWLEASSANFVVYADDSERDILKFSQQLERFHSALGVVTSNKLASPSPSNRVTVYVVKNSAEVRKLFGDKNSWIAAFYLPRPGGSLAIVSSIKTGAATLDFSMTALLHEYTHHYMFATSTFSMPRWYAEGAAEFFASASFFLDGSVGIGQPAEHRAPELFQERDVRVPELLDTQSNVRRGRDAFYGKSWLLFHYLTFAPERRGQLDRYLTLMARGKSSKEAGIEAFGDLDQLEKALDVYLQKKAILSLKLAPSLLVTGEVKVRRLRTGEAAAMPVQIRSRRGVDAKLASEILPEARALAARYPDDPAVLSVLAEAEHDAGNDAEAVAAADAAIALDSSLINPYVQKGKSLFRQASKASDPASAFAAARAPFLALNKLENDHPLPLIYNYMSYAAQGKKPSENALNGLRRAVELAPFDASLRLTLASDLVQRQLIAEAQPHLRTIAYSPHGGRAATIAQRVLERLQAQPEWDGQDVMAVMSAAGEEAEAGAAK